MLHRSTLAVLFASTIGIIACGDDRGAPDAFNAHPDSPSGSADAPSGSGAPNAVVVAGDFTAGNPGVMTHIVASVPPTVSPDVAPSGAIGDDPVVRHFGTDLIVVNRSDGNNITLLDDKTFAVIDQLSTGSGTNPQDVTVATGKLYVPIFGGSGVEVLTRGTPPTSKIIDLSADDPDGKPNCTSAFTVGTDVYITCDLLNNGSANLPPRGSGEVFVIDSGSDVIRAKFRMETANPIGLLEPDGNGGLVTSTNDFATGSGCVERITVGTTPSSACIVTNTVLGGFATRVQFDGANFMLAVVENASFHGTLESYDFGTTASALTGSDENIGDVALCANETAIVTDTTTGAAGIRMYQENGTQLTSSAVSVGLVPGAQHGLVCY